MQIPVHSPVTLPQEPLMQYLSTQTMTITQDPHMMSMLNGCDAHHMMFMLNGCDAHHTMFMLNGCDAHHMMFMLYGCDAPYDIHAKWMCACMN